MSTVLSQTIEDVLNRSLREKLEQVGQDLAGQLQNECAQVLDSAVTEARDQSEREAGTATAEALVSGVRAIRAEDSVTGVVSALVGSAAQFAGRAILFVHRNDELMGFRSAGADEGFQDSLATIAFPVASAAAFQEAVDNLSAIVAQGSPDQLPQDMIDLCGLTPEDNVHLLPINLRGKALGVLCCESNGNQEVVEPAIEVLVSVSEAWIEAVSARKKAA